MSSIIKVVDLEKTYGKKVKTHALRGVSTEISKGTFTCIMGPSGHGKSTMLQLIGGLDAPTAGHVVIDGVNITNLKENALADLRAQKIGFVFQQFNLLENLTALENVQIAFMFGGAKLPEGRAKELLDIVGLADKASSKPRELSGGQMQRVAIARALANDPDIMLMDEPTGNLDSESEEVVMNHIKAIHKTGKTIVIVTHSDEVAQAAKQIIKIQDGKIL